MKTNNDKWYATAFEGEIEQLRSLPNDTNIRKPNSEMWGILYRLAGLVNGSQSLRSHEVLNAIKYHSRHVKYTPRQIDYQWVRALEKSEPRYPQVR